MEVKDRTVLNLDESLYDQFNQIKVRLAGSEGHGARGYSLAISSCRAGEGVTTVAFNMASALKSNSASVLLVDGNLRDPGLTQALGFESRAGLSDLIDGKTGLTKTVISSRNGLFFLPAGLQARNPSALFESKTFVNVLQEMKEGYDFLIFDSAPLSCAETETLASRVDGLVLVLEAEKTSWEAAQSAHKKLKSANVGLKGVILNKKRYYIPESIFRLL